GAADRRESNAQEGVGGPDARHRALFDRDPAWTLKHGGPHLLRRSATALKPGGLHLRRIATAGMAGMASLAAHAWPTRKNPSFAAPCFSSLIRDDLHSHAHNRPPRASPAGCV